MQLNVECGVRRDAGQAQPLTTVVAAYQQPAYLNEALLNRLRN